MTPNPMSLSLVASVQQIVNGLTNYDFHGFPIVDVKNQLIGLVTRQNLTVLMRKECWTAPKEEVL